MKKHFGIIGLLALILLASLLAGCVEGPPTDAYTSTNTQTQTGGQTQTQTQTNGGVNLSQLLNSSANYTSVYYEMVTTTPGQASVTMKYWMKGSKYRMDMEDVEGVGTMTEWVFMDEQTAYAYMPIMNVVYRMVYDTSIVPDSPTSMLDYTPTIIGQEVLDGKNCVIVQYTQAGGTVKAWIWVDTGFPVKMETTSSGVTTTIIFRNFSFNDVSDSVFELPDGVPVLDMGDIGL